MNRLAVLLVTLLLLCGTGAQAQNQVTLLDLLSYVPDTIESQTGVIQYLNLPALLSPYNAFTGDNISDVATALQGDAINVFALRLWTGGEFFDRSLLPKLHQPVKQATGISIPDIQTLLTYGESPQQGIVLSGGYTLDDVNSAYQNQGYSEEKTGEFSIWCAPSGCDALKEDPDKVDLANPFDFPALGRQPPVAVSQDVIISAKLKDPIVSGIEGHTAGIGTLAQRPEYIALAHALTDNAPGELIQAYIIPESLFADTMPVITASSTKDELLQLDPSGGGSYLNDIRHYGYLPPYSLAALADYFDGEHDVLVIALVYPEARAVDATVASFQVANRMIGFRSALLRSVPEYPILQTSRAISDLPSLYVDKGTNVPVARITIVYPLPAYDPGSKRNPPPGGGIFSNLVRAQEKHGLFISPLAN